MEQDTQETIVSFRVWNDGDVIAIFPGQEGAERYTCGSYMHVGQHSDCSPQELTSVTRPAKPEESAALKRELEGIGYRLRVVARLHSSMYWWNKKET